MGAYALAAEVGFAIPVSRFGLTLFWPAAAVSLTGLLLLGLDLWPAVFISDVAIRLLHGYRLSLSIGVAAANTVGALTGATLLKCFQNFKPSLARLRDAVGFILLGALLGSAAGAALWGSYARIVLRLTLPGILDTASVWARANIVSILVLAPALLLWNQRLAKKTQLSRWPELAITFCLLVVVDSLFFGRALSGQWGDRALGYFAFALIIWLAVRFDARGETAGVVLTSVIAISGMIWNKGPFGNQNVFAVQLFLVAVSITPLMVAAIISERRQVESTLQGNQEQLAASVGHYRDLFESAEDLIVTLNLEGRFTSANQAALRTSGYNLKEFLELTFLDIVAAASLESAWSGFKDVISGEKRVQQTPHQIVCKDGKILWVEVNSWPLTKNGAMVGIQSIARDVTWRKRLEQEILQGQKMEAIGRLAGGVAHDFNNLLGVIIGYSDLILCELSGKDSIQEKVEEIKKAGTRAAEVTRQLLAFSRKQLLQPKIVDLSLIVSETTRMLLRLLGEDIELITKLNPTATRVRTDSCQMQQVIINLAINARDAMPSGGKLVLETPTVELRRPDGWTMFEPFTPRGPAVVPGLYVVLAVTDTGIGMDQETKLRIFDPFFTTKPEGEGTGLGLSIVYGFVKQSGGYIWVYSEPGHGTTFKIYLPQIASPEDGPEQGTQLTSLPRGSETILLVEDEESLRQLNAELIESLGYSVLRAGYGAEALEIAGSHSGEIDLLLSDVVMPGLSGRELAERLALSRPEMKVVYMSGYTDKVMMHHGILNSNIAFLQKPFTRDALARKLREVLGPPEKNSRPEHLELLDCHSPRSIT